MKCPKNDKNCQPTLIIKAKKQNNFICSGVNFKPTNYKHDNIWLCCHGADSKFDCQMTVEEALYICTVLNNSLGFLAPAVIQKANKKRKK